MALHIYVHIACMYISMSILYNLIKLLYVLSPYKVTPSSYITIESESISHLVVSNSLPPQSPPSWDSPGKNTGMGFHALLQGIFLTCCIAGRFFTVRATREWHT